MAVMPVTVMAMTMTMMKLRVMAVSAMHLVVCIAPHAFSARSLSERCNGDG